MAVVKDFVGPHGVMMYRAVFELKSKPGKKYALRQEMASIGSAEAQLGMRFGHSNVRVLSVTPDGRNPELPGVHISLEEWEPFAKAGRTGAERGDKLEKWLDEKAREVMHGDETATVRRSTGRKPSVARRAAK